MLKDFFDRVFYRRASTRSLTGRPYSVLCIARGAAARHGGDARNRPDRDRAARMKKAHPGVIATATSAAWPRSSRGELDPADLELSAKR